MCPVLRGVEWAKSDESFVCRYERSEGGIRMGRALVQRHVALSSDVANKQGEGLLVRVSPCLQTLFDND